MAARCCNHAVHADGALPGTEAGQCTLRACGAPSAAREASQDAETAVAAESLSQVAFIKTSSGIAITASSILAEWSLNASFMPPIAFQAAGGCGLCMGPD